ncbi:MAG: winged helix-turn-helix domain-containing protein [Candidatus Methanofastidiosia archaeon]
MKNMFLKEKTVSIMVALFESKKSLYVSEVAKKSDCMYPYALGVLNKFEEKGFVTSKKEGRTRYFTLTASGKKIASSLRKTQDMIRQVGTS